MEPRPKEAETETIRFESIQAEPWREEGVLNKHLWEQQHGICVYQGYQKTSLGHFQCQHLVYFSSVFQWCSKGEQKLRFFSSSVSNRSVVLPPQMRLYYFVLTKNVREITQNEV